MLETKKVRRKPVNVDDRIAIIIEYREITGLSPARDTLYKGYPVGVWEVQLRSKVNTGKTKLTDEQRGKLQKYNVLERMSIPIDNSIDILIKWKSEHPEAEFGTRTKPVLLRKDGMTDEEYKTLCETYDKMIKKYNYIREQNSIGQLSHEQYLKCKDGNIGGIFGYPTRIEELAKKYDVPEKKIVYIEKKFGSVDKFYEQYKLGLLQEEADISLANKMIKGIIDIDRRNDKACDELYRSIIRVAGGPCEIGLYSSSDLITKTSRLIGSKTSTFKAICMKFGFEGYNPCSFSEIGESLNISKQRAHKIVKDALEQLADGFLRDKYEYQIDRIINSESLTAEERLKLDGIKEVIENIHQRNLDLNSPQVLVRLDFLRTIKKELKERSKSASKQNVASEDINQQPDLTNNEGNISGISGISGSSDCSRARKKAISKIISLFKAIAEKESEQGRIDESEHDSTNKLGHADRNLSDE